jgi:hypothetical protein
MSLNEPEVREDETYAQRMAVRVLVVLHADLVADLRDGFPEPGRHTTTDYYARLCWHDRLEETENPLLYSSSYDCVLSVLGQQA